jgi:hypothetical protein
MPYSPSRYVWRSCLPPLPLPSLQAIGELLCIKPVRGRTMPMDGAVIVTGTNATTADANTINPSNTIAPAQLSIYPSTTNRQRQCVIRGPQRYFFQQAKKYRWGPRIAYALGHSVMDRYHTPDIRCLVYFALFLMYSAPSRRQW